jgi:hypothetical protein
MSAIITMLYVEGIWWICNDRLPIVIYTDHSALMAAKFERCVLLNMKLMGTSVSLTLNIE